MEELFLETEAGRIPISREAIMKFNLHRGELSPFTRNRIVDKNGDFTPSRPVQKFSADSGNNPGTTQSQVEPQGGIVLEKSEIIDIAEGTDSLQ